jgi:hypothetical protein
MRDSSECGVSLVVAKDVHGTMVKLKISCLLLKKNKNAIGLLNLEQDECKTLQTNVVVYTSFPTFNFSKISFHSIEI